MALIPASDFLAAYMDPKVPTNYDYKVEDLIAYFRDKERPVIAPYRSAICSDGEFAILEQVLARLSGENDTVANVFEDSLWKPLGMNSTTTKVPKGSGVNAVDRTRVTNKNNTSWGFDIEVVASTGGIYSSTADLRAAGLSILNSELLSGPTTSAWMKPRSGTGSLVELVGAPWEITRLEIPATAESNRTRISDLYTKAGANRDYTAIFALSPDHGIGYSILTAGTTASTARWPLRDVVGETFIPAAEHAAAENAAGNLAGSFVDENAGPGTNITLSVDRELAGLGLKSFWIKGENRRDSPHFRLYPTGLDSISDSLSSLYASQGSIRIAHRMVLSFTPLKPRAAVEGGSGGLFDNSFSWMNIDFSGSEDMFIFNLTDGYLASIEHPNTGAVMKRVDFRE